MTLRPGIRLNAYELIAPLGSGGMGEVWLATETRLGRKIALKLLPAQLTEDSVRVARFEHEARAASALNHPNVCTIHALGETSDGQHFIAMEYVEGQTLRQRLAFGRLALREALDIVIQSAAALNAAHAVGIIHRDIKPENVMLRPDGLVKVLDFGLAKLMPAAAPPQAETRTTFATQAGSLVGTIRYMSPEQVRGAGVDGRTDIWALGVVLYELLAGQAPFTGATQSDVLAAILERDPAPLAEREPRLAGELGRIVAKTLQKDPDRRYQVVRDLQLDLETLREQPGATGAAGTGSSRWWPYVVLAGGAAAVAVAAVTLATRPPRPAAPTPPRVDRPLTRVTFGPGLQTDATFSPDGRTIAYASDRGGNFDIWIQPVSGGQARQLTSSPAQERQPSWSPDGRRLVFRADGNPGGLFVIPADGGVPRQVSSFGAYPSWSRDGAEVMFRMERFGEGLNDDLFAVAVDSGDPPREILADFLADGAWWWIAPHPDGRISAFGVHAKRRFGFFTVSRDGREVTQSEFAAELPLRWDEEGTSPGRFEWGRDGTALYAEIVVKSVRNLWKVRVDPVTLRWIAAERLTTGPGPDVAPVVSADGTRLAFTAQHEAVRLWDFPFDATAGRLTGGGRPVTPEDEHVHGFALSHDGRFVACVISRIGSARESLYLLDLDNRSRQAFGEGVGVIAWSRDGKKLAYVLRRVQGPPPGEGVLVVHEIGGPQRFVGGWSSKSLLVPTDWTADGHAVLGSYIAPAFTGVPKLVVRPIDPIGPDRVLLGDPGRYLYQGRFSPDTKWLSFVFLNAGSQQGKHLAIVRAQQPSFDRAIPVAADDTSADKPRWAPNGRMLYYISTAGSPFYNLWGVRFDPELGRIVDDPFRVTNFDSPATIIWPNMGDTELGIAARRAIFNVGSVTGSIWMLDDVDK
jgi:Tol biopolymer transport system component